MQKKLLLLVLFTSFVIHSQSISVTSTQFTVPQLVQDVLFGNTGTSCFSGQISNVTWSTGTNFGSANGIGYFTNTNPNFPINSGVVLSTGNAESAHGPNTSTLSEGSWPGDTELFNYISGLGIEGPNAVSYNDATVIEFDFAPYVSHISFDFLFASEEYGTFQCSYSDAFAFFLTDVTAGTPTQNLALIPNTNTPISVVTVRDMAYNNSCSSSNVTYFGNYNGGTNIPTAADNFNGETILLNANASVIPQHTYHMKLVIADRNDSSYDSAVFLAANSFDFGISPLTGTGVYNGMNDIIDTCPNEEIVIQAGQYTIPNVTYSWTQDGELLPAITTSTLTVTQAGIYGVTLTGPNGCQISSDTMSIQYYDPLPINNPIDLNNSGNVFDLTTNTAIILNGANPSDYIITYYNSLSDAQQYINPIANALNYIGQDGEILYAATESALTGCVEIKSFMLNPPPAPSNDKCADAVTLSVGNSFDDFPISTTNFAATNNGFNTPSFCDGYYEARDIWFSLTVPSSGNITIETQGNGGLDDTVLEAFSSCNSNVSIGCNNNNDGDSKTANLFSKLELTGLTPGQNIVVRAFGKSTAQGSFMISAYETSLSNSEINLSKLQYYPVPVVDFLNVSNNYTIRSIEIYNMLGQKVLNEFGNNSNEMRVNMIGLQASVYLVKVIGETKTETFRVLKN
ncbi:choice-of-anchor L domain-containing protein [Flavobacterium sp.]|uniref:choice-of-anchor L domain-containing protein n=1 Tax=Flavobacterium sp. TaxID=239 RepID=UPI002FD942AC